MKLDPGFLQTRVARRMLLLFVVSTVVPLLAMAGVSFLAVTFQLKKQSRDRLEQFAKNTGQSVLQQMNQLENELRALRASREVLQDLPTLSSTLPQLRALSVFDSTGAARPLFGPPMAPPALSPGERATLDDGRMLVLPGDQSRGDTAIYAGLVVDSVRPEAGVLWAQAIQDSIFGAAVTFAEVGTVAEFCILGPREVPLHCKTGGVDFAEAYAPPESDDIGASTFPYRSPDSAYIVGFWSFSPSQNYTLPEWTVLVAESEAEVFSPLQDYRLTFFSVLFLAFSIALLLSNVQIRRTMSPLTALDGGTRRIAEGDLTSRVEVATEDEFGSLAQSFNRMADHLKAQFVQLEAGRAIDRAVLGAFDREEVLRAVLGQVPSVTGCRSVGILLTGRSEKEPATLYWDSGAPELGSTEVALSDADREWLKSHPHHGTPEPGTALATGARMGLGPGRLTALPFLVKGETRGALVLESAADGSVTDEELRRARQLANQVAVALDDVSLVEELEDTSWGALRALARAIDAKSRWTAGHSERVTELALALGREMGLPEKDLDTLHRGGLLHDVGKIGIPAEILDEPHGLSTAQRTVIEQHPVIGARILEPIRAFEPALPIVLQHHERWDGKGYPDRLAGEEIHPLARVLSVADVYDALASARPYRKGMDPGEVLGIIQEGSGAQFEPKVVDAFLARMAHLGITPSNVSRAYRA